MDKKYTFRNIILSLVILVVAYIYCLVNAPSIEKIDDDSLTASIANVHKMCFINCKSKECKDYISSSRGNSYFVSIPENEQEYIKGCIITFWGFTHFLLYFILTLLVPSLYIEFFFLGIGFEIYEYYVYKCHDVNDIFLNTLGIIIGKYLSPYNT